MDISSILTVVFLLRIIIPGFVISFLFGRLLYPHVWANLGDIERTFVGLFVGLVTYFTGLGYYAKVYFPWIQNGMKPLELAIRKLVLKSNVISFQLNNKNIDAFHSLFWLSLDISERDDLRFYYSYYLFEIYISCIMFLYFVSRIIALRFHIWTDLEILMPVLLTASFLYWKSGLSLKHYCQYFITIMAKEPTKAIVVLKNLVEIGPDSIPSPRPFA